jgi:hypothetical protein
MYVISSVGPYQRNEKIILEVSIRGRDGRKHRKTAMVDCGATENFVDKNYTKKYRYQWMKRRYYAECWQWMEERSLADQLPMTPWLT